MSDSTRIDMDKKEIDTPALLINLDLLEKNIQTMADYYQRKKGAVLRPHQKGHRLPIIAKKQIDAGARGVSMTSLGLAEYYVNCGITDILITSEIYGKNKIRRLCAMSHHADVTIGVDNLENVKQISTEALNSNTKINVAVELYMGMGSCGVEIGRAKSFVKELIKFRGVTFEGFWWHQGSLADIKNWEERERTHFKMIDKIALLRDELEDEGISTEMLSGGYTCTWNITPEHPRLKNVEVQAGSYVFSDWCSHESEGLEVFDYALTVLTRCTSTPKHDQALFDFGLNSCSHEHTDVYQKIVGPKFKDIDDIKKIKQREEISMIVHENVSRVLKVGDVCELIPTHSDTTAKLYDKYY